MGQGIASTTRRTYSTAQKRFIDFCYRTNQLSPSGFPCPASEWTLMLFATHLAGSIHANSIKVYLAGVRSLHIEQGFRNPLENCLRLERVLRGIKRTHGNSTSARLPVTIDVLRTLRSQLELTRYDDILFWAACCLGFFGFLRCGEFTTPTCSSFNKDYHLSIDDISVDRHISPNYMMVKIKASKTDPFRKGVTLRLETSGSSICAVRAVLQYLHARGNAAGPLFIQRDGKPLTRTILSRWLQSTANRAGLKGTFSGHSFRIGAATTAALAGIPDHLIKTLGRWESNAYQLYIRTPAHILDNVPSVLTR